MLHFYFTITILKLWLTNSLKHLSEIQKDFEGFKQFNTYTVYLFHF